MFVAVVASLPSSHLCRRVATLYDNGTVLVTPAIGFGSSKYCRCCGCCCGGAVDAAVVVAVPLCIDRCSLGFVTDALFLNPRSNASERVVEDADTTTRQKHKVMVFTAVCKRGMQRGGANCTWESRGDLRQGARRLRCKDTPGCR